VSVERWRSKATRDLVRAIRSAGGSVERTGKGKLLVTGPTGRVVINEPATDVRRDLRGSGPVKLIREATGLKMT
jgi:hypothetical protein